ncbi:MAG TPA: tetratricopeptide repeat protein, partial [Actinomycetota bacterium]|nr:tetratricopeptide repeat protein [Actinomycetota bacterium]
RLAPLTEVESGNLIDALLPDEEPTVRTQILERTDGNPLFVEEVAVALLEHDEIAIPDTLQALFTTRLDALDEDCKHTLQLASVIGRSFSEPVLRAVSGDEDLTSSLRTLEREGLISETARTPDREYAFHHSLTQDATYGTILLRRRRELHQRVGEVFEARYANRLDEFAPVLAHHFREAGDEERTLRYATLAGDQAARLYANAEAAGQYATAIEAADRLGKSADAIAHLYPSRGRVLELSGRYQEAVADYEQMAALARDAGDRGGVLRAEMSLTTIRATPTPMFDGTAGRELAERTIALARELGDRSAESKALWNLMILDVFGGGDADEAVEVGQRSLEIARELDAREQIAFTLNDLWRPYAAVGNVAAARACLEEARPIWREMGNLPMLCENLIGTAALLALAGEPEEALALYDEAYAISEEIGNTWGQAHSLFNAYLVDVEQGNVGRSMARMRECIQRSEEAGFLIPQSAARADLGVQYARLGQIERGTRLADQGLEIAKGQTPLAVPMAIASKAEILFIAGVPEQAELALSQAELSRLPGPVRGAASAHVDILRGRLALARGDYAEAVEIADAVIAWLHGHELRQFLPAALLLKSRALIASERPEQADPLLREARSRAEDMGFRRLLWEIDWELSRLAAGRGDANEAAALRAEAASIVSAIAETIDDAELRASFRALPDVRAVLEGAG